MVNWSNFNQQTGVDNRFTRLTFPLPVPVVQNQRNTQNRGKRNENLIVNLVHELVFSECIKILKINVFNLFILKFSSPFCHKIHRGFNEDVYTIFSRI